jgi:dCMP deaminase
MAEEKYVRPSWDEYFMSIAREVGKRGTCGRGRNGCVIVRNKRIIATGYAGAPAGLPHCDEVGHLMRKTIDENGKTIENCLRTTHAEQNAVAQAALHGISTEGSTLYIKFGPCLNCAKLLINAGVKRIVCEKKYQDGGIGYDFLKQAGVEVNFLTDEIEKY